MEGNNEPYLTLELDEIEAKWLAKTMAHRKSESDYNFYDLSSMPSSDPRANMRSLLSMAVLGEQVMSEKFCNKMGFKKELDGVIKEQVEDADNVFRRHNEDYNDFKNNS